MALSKTDQVRFEGIQQTLTMLNNGGLPLEQIKAMMAPQLIEFQKVTNHKVRYVTSDKGVTFELLNLSKDFLRVRGTEEQKTLRAKIQGVPVDVKVFKEEDFLFSNEDVVSALRALADELEALPFQVNTLDITADIRKDMSKAASDANSDGELEPEDTEEVEESEEPEETEE